MISPQQFWRHVLLDSNNKGQKCRKETKIEIASDMFTNFELFIPLFALVIALFLSADENN